MGVSPEPGQAFSRFGVLRELAHIPRRYRLIVPQHAATDQIDTKNQSELVFL